MALPMRIDDIYRGRTVPAWLRRFESEPDAAFHDFLLGRAALGHLDPAEPAVLMGRWLEGLGDDFSGSVDEALAGWIECHWGKPTLPESRGSVRLTVRAWQTAFDILGRDERLVRALAVLRRFMPAERAFLAAMREGRSHDPESRALLALALRQSDGDRSLAEHWWRLCKLPPEMPLYYGGHGVRGLLYLPEESRGTGGGFPHEAAEGLLLLGSALARRVEDGWIEVNDAKEEFLRTARRTMWAMNLQDRWVSFWRQTLPPQADEDGTVDEWVRQLFPEKLKKASRRQWKRRRHVEPNREWAVIAGRIRQKLGKADDATVADAWALLRDQQHFAEATGETHFVVRTASNFAGRVRGRRPELALEWTRFGRRFDPRDAYVWRIEAMVLLQLERLAEARRTAFEAVRRFPYDDASFNTLAQILKAGNRLDDAEDVYREAVRRFSDDPVARNGLAEVLKDQGRLDEAEDVYREAVRRFSDDPVARTGLAELLKDQGRLDDAEDVYRETVRRFSDDPVARTGLGDLLRTLGCLDEAEELYRSVLKMKPGDRFARGGLAQVDRLRHHHVQLSHVAEPETAYQVGARESFDSDDVDILLQDAFLLRHWARHRDPAERRTRARHLLERLTGVDESSPAAASEQGLLGLEAGEIDEALRLLRLAVERFPGSARVRYALARAELATAAQGDETAEEALRPWKKLGRVDRRLFPVQLLGEARTLALRPGEAVRAELCDRFGQLGWWIENTFAKNLRMEDDEENAPFQVRWARELKDHLFSGETVAHAEDIEDVDVLCRNLVANDHALGFQEETWVSQLDAA